MLEVMRLRKLAPQTQASYVRSVRRLAGYLRRPPDTATVELKLREGLKRRIARLAGAANNHAFMVSQEADRAEIRERFANDAAVSETETMESGKAVPLAGRI